MAKKPKQFAREESIGLNGRLRGEILGWKRSVRLTKPFIVRAGVKEITVPIGFVTNFASTPRMVWPIMPPWGEYMEAAAVHDYCYAIGMCTRKKSDAVFLHLMKRLGVAFWKRRIMWRAVRLGGWYRWWKCKRKRKKGET